MQHIRAKIGAALLCVLCVPALISATSSLPQCVDLVKECYRLQDTHRENCFFTVAKHPFCEGSSLGDLAYQRWAMSPNKPAGLEDAPALLGPQLIDQQCLANFDSNWSGQLLQGTIDDSKLKQLSDNLKTCRREVSIELPRP